ncbi:MAG TPA: hypothetical protein DCG69_12535 [Bacteroidales bacterium]|nr:hypothetical protein [Bacteroidales bacterium]
MIAKTIAKSISILFHPILYPIYGFLLLFFFDSDFFVVPNEQTKLYLLSMVVLNTLLFPLILLYYFKKRGFVRSIQLKTKEERIFPLLVMLLFYALSWYTVNGFQEFLVYAKILGLATIVATAAFIANFFLKISLHSIGAAAFAAALLALGYLYKTQTTTAFVVAALLSILIAYARIVLKAHRPSEVYIGFLLGFLLGFFTIVLI